MADDDTRVVEYTCRHRDVLTRPLYGDWLGTYGYCEPCRDSRKIVWTDWHE